MSSTIELLKQLKYALKIGQISIESFPLEDVKDAVKTELSIYRNTFLEEQYKEVIINLNELSADLFFGGYDQRQLIIYLDACVLALSMISRAVLSLINREYWETIHYDKVEDPYFQEILLYIDRHHQVTPFPYEYLAEYTNFACDIFWDERYEHAYVNHNGRSMYFPADWTEERIASYYNGLLAEQDSRSPHCYDKDGYGIEEGDVVLDAGAAEGIYAMNILDKAEKIYLVECDETWLSCLRITFEKEIKTGKVVLVDKFLSDIEDVSHITVDAIMKEDRLNYIKMDIEGFEREALQGAKNVLKKAKNMRLAICSYHCEGDEQWIKAYLKKLGYDTTTSEGYMIPEWDSDSILKAQLRRGIVFGRRNNEE